jgi:hypothetical protein
VDQLFSFKTILYVLFLGNAALVLTTVFYRAWKGKHQSVSRQDIGFSERWVSGFSGGNPQAKQNWSLNCLAVELSRKALVIRVMFPFYLQSIPEIYGGLEHYIPREKIKSIRPVVSGGKRKAADGGGVVIIVFESPSGEQSVELALNRRDEFFRAAGAAFGRQPVPSGIFT